MSTLDEIVIEDPPAVKPAAPEPEPDRRQSAAGKASDAAQSPSASPLTLQKPMTASANLRSSVPRDSPRRNELNLQQALRMLVGGAMSHQGSAPTGSAVFAIAVGQPELPLFDKVSLPAHRLALWQPCWPQNGLTSVSVAV